MSCFRLSIVIGKVAEEDAVEKAVNIARDEPKRVLTGLTRPIKRSNKNKVPNACKHRAISTARVNIINGPVALRPASAITAPTNPNTPIGANFITNSVIFIIV